MLLSQTQSHRVLATAVGDRPRNRLLSAFTDADMEALRPHGREVTLTGRTVLFEPGQSISSVYFPESAVVCLLAIVGDHHLEVATVGSEGMAGIGVFLGDQFATLRAMVQMDGTATQYDATAFARVAAESATVKAVMQRYAHATLVQATQTAACNALHRVDQRCARWLLSSHDRVGNDTLRMTHDLVASTLSVRRSGVTVAMRHLQDQGLVKAGRGKVTILNRHGLESASCDCYRLVADVLDRILTASPPTARA